MYAPLQVCLFLLLVVASRARPPPSGRLDGGGPSPSYRNLQQYLTQVQKGMTKVVQDANLNAQQYLALMKKKHADLIRQHFYALTPTHHIKHQQDNLGQNWKLEQVSVLCPTCLHPNIISVQPSHISKLKPPQKQHLRPYICNHLHHTTNNHLLHMCNMYIKVLTPHASPTLTNTLKPIIAPNPIQKPSHGSPDLYNQQTTSTVLPVNEKYITDRPQKHYTQPLKEYDTVTNSTGNPKEIITLEDLKSNASKLENELLGIYHNETQNFGRKNDSFFPAATKISLTTTPPQTTHDTTESTPNEYTVVKVDWKDPNIYQITNENNLKSLIEGIDQNLKNHISQPSNEIGLQLINSSLTETHKSDEHGIQMTSANGVDLTNFVTHEISQVAKFNTPTMTTFKDGWTEATLFEQNSENTEFFTDAATIKEDYKTMRTKNILKEFVSSKTMLNTELDEENSTINNNFFQSPQVATEETLLELASPVINLARESQDNAKSFETTTANGLELFDNGATMDNQILKIASTSVPEEIDLYQTTLEDNWKTTGSFQRMSDIQNKKELINNLSGSSTVRAILEEDLRSMVSVSTNNLPENTASTVTITKSVTEFLDVATLDIHKNEPVTTTDIAQDTRSSISAFETILEKGTESPTTVIESKEEVTDNGHNELFYAREGDSLEPTTVFYTSTINSKEGSKTNREEETELPEIITENYNERSPRVTDYNIKRINSAFTESTPFQTESPAAVINHKRIIQVTTENTAAKPVLNKENAKSSQTSENTEDWFTQETTDDSFDKSTLFSNQNLLSQSTTSIPYYILNQGENLKLETSSKNYRDNTDAKYNASTIGFDRIDETASERIDNDSTLRNNLEESLISYTTMNQISEAWNAQVTADNSFNGIPSLEDSQVNVLSTQVYSRHAEENQESDITTSESTNEWDTEVTTTEISLLARDILLKSPLSQSIEGMVNHMSGTDLIKKPLIESTVAEHNNSVNITEEQSITSEKLTTAFPDEKDIFVNTIDYDEGKSEGNESEHKTEINFETTTHFIYKQLSRSSENDSLMGSTVLPLTVLVSTPTIKTANKTYIQNPYQNGVLKFTSEIERENQTYILGNNEIQTTISEAPLLDNDNKYARIQSLKNLISPGIPYRHRSKRSDPVSPLSEQNISNLNKTVDGNIEVIHRTNEMLRKLELTSEGNEDVDNPEITPNASTILELLPLIVEGIKNNAFTEEDIKIIRVVFGEVRSLINEESRKEIPEKVVEMFMGDDESGHSLEESDYESSQEAFRESAEERRVKRFKKSFLSVDSLVKQKIPSELKEKLALLSSLSNTRRIRSTGTQPNPEEAAAILALLNAGSEGVQLDLPDDEDDDDYEYYEDYDYSEEDSNPRRYISYEDKSDGSFKELIRLAEKHRQRKANQS